MSTFAEALRAGRVFHALRAELHEKGLAVTLTVTLSRR
jgi:hypothetical protein